MNAFFQKKYIIPVLASAFLFVGVSFKNDFFEIAKQIEIFTTLFKEVNSNYVDETNPGDLMDKAIIDVADDELDTNNIKQNYQKIDEIPFDFSRRRLSVVLADHSSPSRQLICKGALEEILSICSQTRMNNEIKPLTSELLTKISTITRKMNEEGLRVVAVASKNLSKENRAYTVADETDLILEGYIAFLDPPKETTAPALKLL